MDDLYVPRHNLPFGRADMAAYERFERLPGGEASDQTVKSRQISPPFCQCRHTSPDEDKKADATVGRKYAAWPTLRMSMPSRGLTHAQFNPKFDADVSDSMDPVVIRRPSAIRDPYARIGETPSQCKSLPCIVMAKVHLMSRCRHPVCGTDRAIRL
jgi:hypothetical protein